MASALYDRIRQELEARIVSGEWPPGTQVPTEADLAATYQVSRVTVQRAVGELAQKGLVVRYRRRGTFVARATPERNLLRLANPHSAAPEIEGRHLVTDARVIPAQDADPALPGLPHDTPVVQLRRTKLDASERPIAIEATAIPFSLAPRLLEEPLEDVTTLAYFRRTGVPIHRSRLYVEPVLLSPDDAATLHQQPGLPVFRLRRHVWLTDGDLAEAFASVLLPDHSPFYIEQSLAEPPPTPGEEGTDT